MGKSAACLLASYIDDVCVNQERSEKIKKARRRKRVEEAICVAILQNDPRRAVDLAEKHNIPPQDFGKLVARCTQFVTK